MRLTKPQQEILLHRIESGCIAEALVESGDAPNIEAANAAVEKMESLVNSGNVECSNATEIEVLVDCLDGCTFFCGIDDEIAIGRLSKGDRLNYFRAAMELERWLTELAGKPVNCTTA